MNKFQWCFLKDIAVSQTGPFGSQLHEHDYVSIGTPIVTVEHLGEISFSLDNLPLVSDKDKARLIKYTLKEGDIVFSRVGSIDKCTYVTKKEDGWMFSGRCLRVRFNDKANAKYVSFYFRQKYFKEMMLNISVGATMPSLNTTLMDNIPLFLPSLSIQKKVADVLSSLDSKIELNNRINAELEAMAKTLYDFWFVQFDFPDTNGKPYKTSGGKMVWNEELKRVVPEGWDNGRFGGYAKLKGGYAFKSAWWAESGLPVIKIKDINEDYTLSIENCSYVGEDKYLIAKNYEACSGDVVIALTGATVGKYGIVTKTQKPILVNQRVGLFKLGKKPLDNLPFLINSLNQEYFRKTVFVLASGAAQPNISTDQIDEIPLVIPQKEILIKFNKTCSSFYENIIKNQLENQQLAELRDWLLPMLMNGKVTVKDMEEENLAMAAEPEVAYGKKKTK